LLTKCDKINGTQECCAITVDELADIFAVIQAKETAKPEAEIAITAIGIIECK